MTIRDSMFSKLIYILLIVLLSNGNNVASIQTVSIQIDEEIGYSSDKIIIWKDVITNQNYNANANKKIRVSNGAVEFIVHYQTDTDTQVISNLLQQNNIEIIRINQELGVFIVNIPIQKLNQDENFIEKMLNSEFINYVEPSSMIELHTTPNDPFYDTYQWGPQKINIEGAWDVEMGSRDVIVGIIDTGVDLDHVELDANYLPLGYDWARNDYQPDDEHLHGSHVSGTIIAEINNSIGISGLANVSYFSEKVFYKEGGTLYAVNDDLVAMAIRHAVNQGADILSNSWGGDYSKVIYDAIDYAISKNVIVIASMGNDGSSTIQFPAAQEGVIAVGSTDQNDLKSYYSNYGEWISVVAPGRDIYSTNQVNGYSYSSGTSMSVPHVSGLVALIRSKYPKISHDGVLTILQNTSIDLGNPGFDNLYGWGRIDANRTLHGLNQPYARWERNKIGSILLNTDNDIEGHLYNLGNESYNQVIIQIAVNNSIVHTNQSVLHAGDTFKLKYAMNTTILGNYNYSIEISLYNDTSLLNQLIDNFMVEVEFYPDYDVTHSQYNWIDIASQTNPSLLTGDEASMTFDLPFQFSFYNDIYQSINVSTNGKLTFNNNANYIDYSPVHFPNTTIKSIISPFWTDLIIQNNLFILNNEDVFGVEFRDVVYYSSSAPFNTVGSFQVLLFSNSTIKFQYKYVNYFGEAVVGINSGYGTGIEILDIPANFSAITFTPNIINSDEQSPTITGLEYFQMLEGDNAQIDWSIYDENPGYYELYRNGTLIETNNWSNNENISSQLVELSNGVYEFELIVFDQYNNYNSFNTIVVVLEVIGSNSSTEGSTTFEAESGFLTISNLYGIVVIASLILTRKFFMKHRRF